MSLWHDLEDCKEPGLPRKEGLFVAITELAELTFSEPIYGPEGYFPPNEDDSLYKYPMEEAVPLPVDHSHPVETEATPTPTEGASPDEPDEKPLDRKPHAATPPRRKRRRVRGS